MDVEPETVKGVSVQGEGSGEQIAVGFGQLTGVLEECGLRARTDMTGAITRWVGCGSGRGSTGWALCQEFRPTARVEIRI